MSGRARLARCDSPPMMLRYPYPWLCFCCKYSLSPIMVFLSSFAFSLVILPSSSAESSCRSFPSGVSLWDGLSFVIGVAIPLHLAMFELVSNCSMYSSWSNLNSSFVIVQLTPRYLLIGSNNDILNPFLSASFRSSSGFFECCGDDKVIYPRCDVCCVFLSSSYV